MGGRRAAGRRVRRSGGGRRRGRGGAPCGRLRAPAGAATRRPATAAAGGRRRWSRRPRRGRSCWPSTRPVPRSPMRRRPGTRRRAAPPGAAAPAPPASRARRAGAGAGAPGRTRACCLALRSALALLSSAREQRGRDCANDELNHRSVCVCVARPKQLRAASLHPGHRPGPPRTAFPLARRPRRRSSRFDTGDREAGCVAIRRPWRRCCCCCR